MERAQEKEITRASDRLLKWQDKLARETGTGLLADIRRDNIEDEIERLEGVINGEGSVQKIGGFTASEGIPIGIKTFADDIGVFSKVWERSKDAQLVGSTTYQTTAKTVSLTKKILKSIGIGTVIMSSIGSYPFAGFIKEEALQTLGFGVFAAKGSGDLEGEQAAIDAQVELLNPEGWNKLFQMIPYANTLTSLQDFYKASVLKTEIDQRNLDKRRAALTPQDLNTTVPQ